MKRWHAFAACAVAALALVSFRTWSGPKLPGRRSAPRAETPVLDSPPAEAEGAAAVPAAVPEAPSPPAPATAVAVVAPPPEPPPVQHDGEDATEAWMRVVAVDLTDEEKATVDRHLTRFVRPPSGAREEAPEVVLLPKADPDAAEKRRIEQLELLRQRKAIKLLDHIGQGLAWLALHQGPDGGISEAAAKERCRQLGHVACSRGGHEPYATAATAFAVIALFDFRDQDAQGVFEPALARAVAWLRAQQRADGTFPGREHYSTAISLIALAQAAASSGSEDLRKAVERGLEALHARRGPDGGYRYEPGEPGDLSVTAWVAQAVEAARRAKAAIPAEMEPGLRRFLDAVWVRDAQFRYTVGGQVRWTLFPAGMLTGLIERDVQDSWPWALSIEGVIPAWREWLKETPKKQKWGIYTTYYAVRVAIALEPELPEEWASGILALAARQRPPGPAAGSFEDTLGAGVVVETAFTVLTLEHALYKR